MHDVEQMMRQRVRELEKQQVPYIAYCHYRDGARGVVIYPLIPQNFLIPAVKFDKTNPLAANSLRHLQRTIDRCCVWPPSTVTVMANLAPLSQEDQAKVLKLVPAVMNAESFN